MITKSTHWRAAACVLALAGAAGFLTGCASGPPRKGPQAREAIRNAPPPPAPSKPARGSSGILPLVSGTDAFVARMALAGQAKRSLDLQYYIWHDDATGKLLTGAVVEAAERGVKVRLLLDDMGTAATDRNLLVLDSHPNLEVRLFNPIRLRSARLLGTLLDFQRLNRRMHNKSFTVDSRITIVGGRNIGDEYFGAAEDLNFADFDVLARGPVVPQVVDAFDRYWNCPAAVPISKVNGMAIPSDEVRQGLIQLMAHRESMAGTPYAQALRSNRLLATPYGNLTLFKGRAAVATDDPAKISTRQDNVSTHLAPQLAGIVNATRKDVLLVSPYFVPGQTGVDWLAGLTRRGVAVKVITNSLATTDVAAVHAGYSRYRKSLLQAGVELHEMKSAPGGSVAAGNVSRAAAGSSKAGLHAKTFVFDRRWVFVGSMNLDPRSIKLNTELGLLIDSPELARRMIAGSEIHLPENAWQVKSTPAGLTWTTTEQGRSVVRETEPAAAFRKNLMWRAASLLPIEGQL